MPEYEFPTEASLLGSDIITMTKEQLLKIAEGLKLYVRLKEERIAKLVKLMGEDALTRERLIATITELRNTAQSQNYIIDNLAQTLNHRGIKEPKS